MDEALKRLVEEAAAAGARAALEGVAKAQAAAPPPGPPRCGITVREVWEEYRLVEVPTLDSKDAIMSRSKPILAFFGHLDCLEVTEVRVAEYRGQRQTKKNGAPIKPATRTAEISLLRAMLNWKVKQGQKAAEYHPGITRVPYNPIKDISMEKEDNTKETKIDKESDLNRLLSASKRAVVHAFTLIGIDTGMRRKEILSMRWDDLCMETGRFKVTSKVAKNGCSRWVYLSPRAIEAVKALPRIGDYVFSTHWKGKVKRYDPRTISRLFEKAVKGSGLKAAEGETITPHTLRHSYVYRARAICGLPESTIMGVTGHKTRSAFQRYGIVDLREIEEAQAAYHEMIAKMREKEQRKSAQKAPADVVEVPAKAELG